VASSSVERFSDKEEVDGSTPSSPTDYFLNTGFQKPVSQASSYPIVDFILFFCYTFFHEL
jgi:hypothetical protein